MHTWSPDWKRVIIIIIIIIIIFISIIIHRATDGAQETYFRWGAD